MAITMWITDAAVLEGAMRGAMIGGSVGAVVGLMLLLGRHEHDEF